MTLFLVTALPPPPPSNVESACDDSGCEGRFKSTLNRGVERECANLQGFCESVSTLLGRIVDGNLVFVFVSPSSRYALLDTADLPLTIRETTVDYQVSQGLFFV